MKPIRIAHISDTHLGYRALGKDRSADRAQPALDRCRERICRCRSPTSCKRDVDLVVHSGDLFNQTRPPYAAIGAAMRQFRRLEEAGIPASCHWRESRHAAIAVVRIGFFAVESGCAANVFRRRLRGGDRFPFPELDLTVTAIPHGRLTEPMPPAAFPNPNTRNVLITHGFVPGMEPLTHKEAGEEEIDETLLPPDFDYIALGHYHVRSHPRPNAWYAGSTERFGFGDEPVKPGYLIVELGDRGEPPAVETILTAARPMLRWRLDESLTNEQDRGPDCRADPRMAARGESAGCDGDGGCLRGAARGAPAGRADLARRSGRSGLDRSRYAARATSWPDSSRERVDLPTIDLEALFAKFVEGELANGNHDAAFSRALR